MAARRRVPGNEFIVDETTHKQRPVRRRVTFESRGSRPLGSADLALYLFNSRGSDSAGCTQARKTTRGLDGQHQDVDRTLRERVNQNDRGQR